MGTQTKDSSKEVIQTPVISHFILKVFTIEIVIEEVIKNNMVDTLEKDLETEVLDKI